MSDDRIRIEGDVKGGDRSTINIGSTLINVIQGIGRAALRREIWLPTALILVLLAGATGWLPREHNETHALVTEPVILKAKLQEEIDKTFATKLEVLKAAGARPKQIDKLYRWRDQTQDQLGQTVAFIQSATETERRSLTAEAARVLQERGVEAALELLTERLDKEDKRHQERGRALAEAALFKADLHKTRYEYPQAQSALEQAIALDHGWWEPHNRLGVLALERADWK